MEPNPKVKIISDSTCDLSQELTAKYDIDILPLHILLGENEFRDGKDITPERIFAWADANKATPKTSAPSLEDAKALLQPYVEAGREVVEEVRSYLKGLTVFCEILETRAGGVISSHCGPGTLGVLFIAK